MWLTATLGSIIRYCSGPYVAVPGVCLDPEDPGEGVVTHTRPLALFGQAHSLKLCSLGFSLDYIII